MSQKLRVHCSGKFSLRGKNYPVLRVSAEKQKSQNLMICVLGEASVAKFPLKSKRLLPYLDNTFILEERWQQRIWHSSLLIVKLVTILGQAYTGQKWTSEADLY